MIAQLADLWADATPRPRQEPVGTTTTPGSRLVDRRGQVLFRLVELGSGKLPLLLPFGRAGMPCPHLLGAPGGLGEEELQWLLRVLGAGHRPGLGQTGHDACSWTRCATSPGRDQGVRWRPPRGRAGRRRGLRRRDQGIGTDHRPCTLRRWVTSSRRSRRRERLAEPGQARRGRPDIEVLVARAKVARAASLDGAKHARPARGSGLVRSAAPHCGASACRRSMPGCRGNMTGCHPFGGHGGQGRRIIFRAHNVSATALRVRTHG